MDQLPPIDLRNGYLLPPLMISFPLPCPTFMDI